LLILDEATSALDSESESLIQDAINKVAQSTTILVIAHRLSTIKRANSVYVLQKGKIVEQGTFADLAGSSASLFSTMIAQQLAIKS
jgi:ABC-type multidrug transport system fused ATPase/permease subunit